MFAKKQISKRTQFGPFVAPTTNEPPTSSAAGRFVLMVRLDLGSLLYTVSQKKLGHFYFCCNFGKCGPISIILSLLDL